MGIQKLVQRQISPVAFLKAACVAFAVLLFGSFSVGAQTPQSGSNSKKTSGAQASPTGFSGIGGNNSKKPIDIDADRLEVDDKKQIAIYIGNVSATQGDYNLRSPRLEVTYEHGGAQGQNATHTQKPAQPQKVANTASPGDPLSSGQIKNIRATGGKVLLVSTKDKQEATGNEAFYDVKAQKVTMTGDVTLSQKGNVVTGQKLLIDLETGLATVVPDENNTQRVHSHIGGEGSPNGSSTGRIRAVIVPSGNGAGGVNPLTGDKKKSKTPDNAADKQSTPSSGWQAQPR